MLCGPGVLFSWSLKVVALDSIYVSYAEESGVGAPVQRHRVLQSLITCGPFDERTSGLLT